MKKLLKLLVVVMVVVVAFSIFTACKGEAGEFKVVVIRGSSEKEYVLDNTGNDMTYLVDALEYLSNDSDAQFSYAMSGTFLSSVDGYVANSNNNEFWAIYTDLELDGIEYFDNSWGTADYDNDSFGSATKGVTELPLNDGCTYIIKLSTW